MGFQRLVDFSAQHLRRLVDSSVCEEDSFLLEAVLF